VAGACLVSRESVTRVISTFPRGKPVTIEARDGRLWIGAWGIETTVYFRSRENESYSNGVGEEPC